MKRLDENKVEYTVECRFCGMRFPSGASFRIHLRMHTRNSPSLSIPEESSRQFNSGEELPSEIHSQRVSNVTDLHVSNSNAPSGNGWDRATQRDDSLPRQEIVPYQRQNYHPSPIRPLQMSRFYYQRNYEPRSAWPTNNQLYGVWPPGTSESHRLLSLQANWIRAMRSNPGHPLVGQPIFRDNESRGNSDSGPIYESPGVLHQNEPQDAWPFDNLPLYSPNDEAPISHSQQENELQGYVVCPSCHLPVINPTIYDNESRETLASPSNSNPIYGSQGIVYQGTPILQCQCANQPRGVINPSYRYPSPQFMHTRPINHGNEPPRDMHFRSVNPLVYRPNYVLHPERRNYPHFENAAQGVIRNTIQIRFAHTPQRAGFYRAPLGTEAITPDGSPFDVTSPDYVNSYDRFPINESSLGATSENYSTLTTPEGPKLFTSPENEPGEVHTVSEISPLISSHSINSANGSYDHSSENLPSTSANIRHVQSRSVYRENISPICQTRPLSHDDNEPRETLFSTSHLMPGHIPNNVNNSALWQQNTDNSSRLIETRGVVNTNSQNESMMSISSLNDSSLQNAFQNRGAAISYEERDNVSMLTDRQVSDLLLRAFRDSSLNPTTEEQQNDSNRRSRISSACFGFHGENDGRGNVNTLLSSHTTPDHSYSRNYSSCLIRDGFQQNEYRETVQSQNGSNSRSRISAPYESSGFHGSDYPFSYEGQGTSSVLTDRQVSDLLLRAFRDSASSLNPTTAEQQNDSYHRRRISATYESSGFHGSDYPISYEGQSTASRLTNRQGILLEAIFGSASSLNSSSESAYTGEQENDSKSRKRTSASHDSTGSHRSNYPISNEGQGTASIMNYRQALLQGISGSASSLNSTSKSAYTVQQQNDSNSIRRISPEYRSAGSHRENERQDTMNMLKNSHPSPKHLYGHSNSSVLIRDGFQRNAYSETNFMAQQQNNNSRRGISSSDESTRFHIESERQVIRTKTSDNLLIPHSTVSINLTGRRLRDPLKHQSVVNTRQIACPNQGAAEFCSENGAQVQTAPESSPIAENSLNDIDPIGEECIKKDKHQLHANCGSDSTLQQQNVFHTTKRRIFAQERSALGNRMLEPNPSRGNEEKDARAVTPDELFAAGPPLITGLIDGRHIRNWPPFEEPHIITPTPRRTRCRIHNGEIRDPRAMSPRRPLYRNIPNLCCLVRGQSNLNHVPTSLPTLTEVDEDQFAFLQQSNSYNYRQSLAIIQEQNRFNEVRHAIQIRYVSGVYFRVSLRLGSALNDANITNRPQTASNSSFIRQQRNRFINRTSTSVRFRIQVLHSQSPNAHVPYMVLLVFGNQLYVCI